MIILLLELICILNKIFLDRFSWLLSHTKARILENELFLYLSNNKYSKGICNIFIQITTTYLLVGCKEPTIFKRSIKKNQLIVQKKTPLA